MSNEYYKWYGYNNDAQESPHFVDADGFGGTPATEDEIFDYRCKSVANMVIELIH